MSSKCIFRYIMKAQKQNINICLLIMFFFHVFIIMYLKNALLYIIYLSYIIYLFFCVFIRIMFFFNTRHVTIVIHDTFIRLRSQCAWYSNHLVHLFSHFLKWYNHSIKEF